MLPRAHRGIGFEVLYHSLADKHGCDDQADREKDPKNGARGVDPKVTDGGRLLARNPANQGNGDRDANGCAEKVVIRQTRHLGEITHGGLWRVCLPVGIGGERDRGVERQGRRDAGQMLRIPRQPCLCAFDHVGQQQ